MGKLKVFTAFSGYDSQCMALDRLQINYELIGWSEIDKYAIQAHNAIYPQWADRNYGDISKINWDEVPNFDLFTYSFPCTDISIAGAQKGFEENSGTRSSLLWECRKAILTKKPKYLLLENVKALVQTKNITSFNKWIIELESYGYTNFTKVLNAKDYGVPQNRERVFVVSIRERGSYEYPKPFKLDKCMEDILEDKGYPINTDSMGNCRTIRAQYYKNSIANFLAKDGKSATGIIINPLKGISGKGWHYEQNVYDPNGISRAIKAGGGSGNIPKIIQIGNIYPDKPNFKNRTSGKIYDKRGISPTINTCQGGGHEPKILDKSNIRKLTPRECFRLMGVSEENIDKIQSAGISNSQQYKLAGNSIVVDVLYYIFKNLLCTTSDHTNQTLFSAQDNH